MARRIAVIISQSPQNQPERRKLEEDLATLLLFERGVDVSLIPHLQHLEAGSTGLLCLEGVKGDMVLLSWLSPDEAHEMLGRLGVAGRRGRTALSTVGREDFSGNGPQGQRHVYHLELRGGEPPEAFIGEIERIRQETSVQTVSLGLSGPGETPRRISNPAIVPLVAPGSDSPNQAPESAGTEPLDSAPRVLASPAPAREAAVPRAGLDDDDAMDARVDQLLEELDQMDW